MDPTLQKLLQSTSALSDAMRQKLIAAGPRLTPPQVQTVIALIQTAEAKRQPLVVALEAKKKEVNTQHLDRLHDFLKHGVPKLLRETENKDRSKEEEDLGDLLSQLDNA